MAIALSSEDFDRVADILGRHGDWQSVRTRIDLLRDVVAGSPRQADLLGQLDLDGSPHGTAVRVVWHFANFGQDEPGRESLGVLVNKLIAHLGGGEDADFLRGLFARYPFTTKPAASRGIPGWQGTETGDRVVEKIIGENTLRDVYVLEMLLDLSRSVVRIQGPSGLGTGFMITADLLMTNHHVIGSFEEACGCAFHFNFQLDRSGKALPVHTARVAKDGLFLTSPLSSSNASMDALDYTIVQVDDAPRGLTPLVPKISSIRRDSRVTIIQHPGGDYKKISLQNNFVEYVDEIVVQYTTSTEPGSSGSPVLADDFTVVAIHHAGGNLFEPATKRRYMRNEGVRMSAILEDIRTRAPEVYNRIQG